MQKKPSQMPVLTAVIIVLLAWCGIRIVERTGHNRWLGLLMAVPLLQLGLLVWLATAEWPARRDPRALPPPDDSDGN